MYQSILDELQERHHIAPELLDDLNTILSQLTVASSNSAPPEDPDSLHATTLYTDDSGDSQGVNAPFDSGELSSLHEVHVLSQVRTGMCGLRYEYRGELGRGGMGVVSRVYDPILQREVAIKIAHQGLLQSPQALNRFVEEGRIQAQLNHPNLVPVYDMGILPDGRPYFTMEILNVTLLLDAIRDLHDVSRDDWGETADGLTLRRLVASLYQICCAVGYAHERGIIHRDLKPNNVVLGPLGEVRVVDWGLAKYLEGASDGEGADAGHQRPHHRGGPETRYGRVSGTPAYMPPEQARGEVERIDARSDVYALGAILYTILSGRIPYARHPERGSLKILDLVKRGAPLPLGELSQLSLPEELVAIVERAMSREMDRRYASAGEMSHALSDWLDGSQRQERARAIVEQGTTLQQEAARLSLLAMAQRREAAERLEAGDLEACWSALEQAGRSRLQAREQEQAAQRYLQGALVIDPSLPVVHASLMTGYDLLAQRARREQDLRAMVDAEALRNAHAQQLPPNDPRRLRLHQEKQQQSRWVLPVKHGGMLVGREQTLRAMRSWWAGQGALLTLVGTAGSGKTRLAKYFIRNEVRGCPLVLFCDLSSAQDAEDIVRLVANTMSLKLHRADSTTQVGNALRGRGRVLLVVDNLEQVREHVPATLGRWLQMNPLLRILATSRVRLGVDGEVIEAVAPLDVLSAVEMFVATTQRARPTFSLSAASLPQVLDVVKALDCLPLAVELAAARTRALGLSGVQDWLKDRFALLRGNVRDPKARALQGALEASWSLLSSREQDILSACSVFRGGWTLEAAEAVCVSEGMPVLDVLDALVDDHLVLRVSDGEEARFSLLESIRVFAAQKRTDLQPYYHRHASFYARYGTREWIAGGDNEDWGGLRYRVLTRERQNLLQGSQSADHAIATQCAMALGCLYGLVGPFAEGYQMLRAVWERITPTAVEHEVRLQHKLATLALRAELKTESREYFERAISLTKETGNLYFEGVILIGYGMLDQVEGKLVDARARYEEGLSIFRDVNDRTYVGAMLGRIGQVEQKMGNLIGAKAYYEEALAIHQEVGNRPSIGVALDNLASVYLRLGKMEQALLHNTASLKIFREVGNRPAEGIALTSLGHQYEEGARYEESLVLFTEALTIHRELGNRRSEGTVLNMIGALLQVQGQLKQALSYHEQALLIHREIGNKRSEGIVLGHIGELHLSAGRAELAEDFLAQAIVICDSRFRAAAGAFRGSLALVHAERGAFDSARQLIKKSQTLLTRDESIDYGKLMCKVSMVEHRAGDAKAARLALDEARDIQKHLGHHPETELGRAIAELETALA